MDLNNTEMQEIADFTAKQSPETLLNALRKNGYFVYTINAIDIETSLDDSPKPADRMLTPITDSDILHVNKKDRDNGCISEYIDHNEIVSAIATELHFLRHKQNEATNK